MKTLELKVNGSPVCCSVEPRTHLADFLRENRLLTGTNLGCEQGVCGACTLMIDGVPQRSCIVFAVACEGADVRTIESFDNDPVMAELRAAFSVEHALQCGYCTPGMLATARDIVTRLPDADDARIRLELSGNLCRCTGYVGLVRAIRRVLDARRAVASAPATASASPSIARDSAVGVCV
jgi:carbon-monoxide dehydrogenase small subunit